MTTIQEEPKKELQMDLRIPLLVQTMEATIVEEPGTKDRKYAYEVTFKAIMPESEIRFMVDYIEEHRLNVRCIKNDLEGV